MISRRRLLEGAGAVAAGTGMGLGLGLLKASAAPLDLPKGLPAGVRAEAALEALPGKKPLIKLSYRPPN
jgi:sulfite dehydrogenase (cytochrome) subunit A